MLKTNIIVTKRAGPKTSNIRRKLSNIKTLGLKYPISLISPASNNEISQIKKYFKFPLSSLFDKGNLKYFFIWLISVLLSGLFKVVGYLNPNVLIINNFLLLLLVFGPGLVVTIILVFNKFSNF